MCHGTIHNSLKIGKNFDTAQKVGSFAAFERLEELLIAANLTVSRLIDGVEMTSL